MQNSIWFLWPFHTPHAPVVHSPKVNRIVCWKLHTSNLGCLVLTHFQNLNTPRICDMANNYRWTMVNHRYPFGFAQKWGYAPRHLFKLPIENGRMINLINHRIWVLSSKCSNNTNLWIPNFGSSPFEKKTRRPHIFAALAKYVIVLLVAQLTSRNLTWC